jgi:hypothetical protein
MARSRRASEIVCTTTRDHDAAFTLTNVKYFRRILKNRCLADHATDFACLSVFYGCPRFCFAKDAIMQHPTHRFLLAAMFVIAFITPGLAQERGTPEQAQSLCDRALLHMKEVGPARAIRDFNDPEGGFIDHTSL